MCRIHQVMAKADRVLVVDDSVGARGRLAQALSTSGFEVHEASEGVEGLYRARLHAFDLVITDVHMPAMDGLVFIRELRKLGDYARTPVIVLTSDFTKDRIEQVRRAGGTAWIEKPPNLATVGTLVRSTIESFRAAPSAQRR
jgi:two-component system, chemotaxis family, chemotaxis protein CheY